MARVKIARRFQTVLADPPWEFGNKRTGGSMSSGSDQKYATLPLNAITSIPVRSVTHSRFLVYLWVPVPLLPWGPQVLTAWGAPYRTSLFWRKTQRRGMGFWYRNQVEILMLGVRGIKPFRCAEENIVEAPATNHSQKPDEFYGLIERNAPGPYLELFATARRPGWTSVGLSLGTEVYKWMADHARHG